jgi:hypothetical protein
MSTAQCNRCRFWKLQEATKDEGDPDWGFGFCRRRPPVLVDSLIAAKIIPPRYGQQSDLDMDTALDAHDGSLWPATFATDWCGEYEEGVEIG